MNKIKNTNILNKTIFLFILTITLSFSLSSCFPEDTLVAQYQRGDAKLGIADITENYNQKVYYNLNENKVVKISNYNDWDISFETNENSFYIMFNPAIIGGAINLGQVNFDTIITNASRLKWTYDDYSKSIDSGAVGKWWEISNNKIISKNDIYLLNLGIDIVGRNVGYRKFQVVEKDDNYYYIKFSDLNNNNKTEFQIPIDKKYERITFTFKNNGLVTYSEPETNSWDILFTKYSEYFEELFYLPYSINGVLLNYNKTLAYVADSTDNTYSELNLENLEYDKFRNNINVIGWDWKAYIFDIGYYNVNVKKTYVIKDSNGYYYKLRFLDFYTLKNNITSKGNISFEFLKL